MNLRRFKRGYPYPFGYALPPAENAYNSGKSLLKAMFAAMLSIVLRLGHTYTRYFYKKTVLWSAQSWATKQYSN